jgi:hypothetical protein
MHLKDLQDDGPIYYIMSDQPDCCGSCGSRLDLLEIVEMDGERIFVSECLGCHREVLLVEK